MTLVRRLAAAAATAVLVAATAATTVVAGQPAQARLWACSDSFDQSLLVRYAAFMPGGGSWTIEADLVGGGEVVLLSGTGTPGDEREADMRYALIGSWEVATVTLTVEGSDGQTAAESVEGPFETCSGCSKPMPRQCDFRGPGRQEFVLTSVRTGTTALL